MIYYSPVSGDVHDGNIKYRPKTCFIMTQLGNPSSEVKNIRRTLNKYLKPHDITTMDATALVTGKDFLNKIWEISLSVPLGIAIITEDFEKKTLANIFYEIGLLQALGKETLIIKTNTCAMPSDFVRTEYIEYDRGFKKKINKFIDRLNEVADYYYSLAGPLENNPVLAMDYCRRAYLISKKADYKEKIKEILKANMLDKYTMELYEHFLRNA